MVLFLPSTGFPQQVIPQDGAAFALDERQVPDTESAMIHT